MRTCLSTGNNVTTKRCQARRFGNRPAGFFWELVLQGVREHAADRPWLAVAGAADIVDLPLGAVAHEIIANDRVGGFGAGRVMGHDGDGDRRTLAAETFGRHRKGFYIRLLRVVR